MTVTNRDLYPEIFHPTARADEESENDRVEQAASGVFGQALSWGKKAISGTITWLQNNALLLIKITVVSLFVLSSAALLILTPLMLLNLMLYIPAAVSLFLLLPLALAIAHCF